MNKEKEWDIEAIQRRYKDLKLSEEQAHRVHVYERLRDLHLPQKDFSMWEGWDFEQSTFRTILTQRQFEKYQSNLQQSVDHHERELRDMDLDLKKDIAFYQDQIIYLEKTLIPTLTSNVVYSSFGWLQHDHAKIDYLKGEYSRFLQRLKKQTLIEHFRQNRQFKPNQLKVSLLAHKTWCILPNYLAFRSEMDQPTAAIDDYLRQKLRRLPEEMEVFFQKAFDDSMVFYKDNSGKHYGESKGGWHVHLWEESEEDRKLSQAITVLLLDERYLKEAGGMLPDETV